MDGLIIELPISIIEITLIMLVFGMLYEKRDTDFWRMPVAVIILTIITQISGHMFGDLGMFSFAVTMTSMVVGIWIVYDCRISSVFMTFLVITLLIGVSDYVGLLISTGVGVPAASLMEPTVPRLVVAVFSKMLFFLIARVVIDKIKYITELDIRRMSQLLIVLIINVIFLFLAADLYFSKREWFSNQVIFAVLVVLGVVTLTILIIRITESIVTYTKKEQDWQVKESEYRRQLFYMDNLQKLTQELRSQRHDFNHHIDCIAGLVEDSKNNEVLSYIHELQDMHFSEARVVDTNHSYITALMNTKAQRMHNVGIKLTSNIYVPTDIGIDPLDISIVLGNTMDNAIEACERSDTADKWILAESMIKDGHFYMKISNSSVTKVEFNQDGIPVTSKKDKENHGFGISNIQFVVQKYDGIYQFKQSNNVFTVNLAFPIN